MWLQGKGVAGWKGMPKGTVRVLLGVPAIGLAVTSFVKVEMLR